MSNQYKSVTAIDVGTAGTIIYTAPALKDTLFIQLDIATTESSGVSVDVIFHDSSAGIDVYWAKQAPVAVGGTLQVIDGQKCILESGDYIKVVSSVVASVHVIASCIEDIN